MNFKSAKGITMANLVIYVSCFLFIAIIVGNLTVFFYNNSEILDTEISAASEYNKLNLFLVKESEMDDNRFEDFGTENDKKMLKFSNGNIYTFDENTGLLYFNGMVICEFTSDFDVTVDYSTGKEVVNVLVKYDNDNISYKTAYTMK